MPFYTVTYDNQTKRIRKQDVFTLQTDEELDEADDDDPIPSFAALKQAIASKFHSSYPTLEIQTIHYTIQTANTSTSILIQNDEDVADMMDDAIQEIIVNKSMNEHPQYSIPPINIPQQQQSAILLPQSSPSNMSNATYLANNKSAALYKEALKLPFQFEGKPTEDVYEFKRNVINHAAVYELSESDLIKLFLSNRYIIGNAFEHIHINMPIINELTAQQQAPTATIKLQRLWHLLQTEYGALDEVHHCQQQLYQYTQATTQPTRIFVNQFKVRMHRLLNEIQIRNQHHQMHHTPTPYELGQILIRNCNQYTRTFVIETGFRQHQTAALTLEQVLCILSQRIQREEANYNIQLQQRKTAARFKRPTSNATTYQTSSTRNRNRSKAPPTFQQAQTDRRSTITCRNGTACTLYQRGICRYVHPQINPMPKCIYGTNCQYKKVHKCV